MKNWLFILIMAVSGCTSKKVPSTALLPQQALTERGRTVYLTNCTACHNRDPHQAGALGPDIWGSSLELIRNRVMSGQYPPGYQPKRVTQVMQPLPHLKAEIEALHAFLNETSPR
ncbi:cytochrome c [Bdellovibrionota bacterium FG-1]